MSRLGIAAVVAATGLLATAMDRVAGGFGVLLVMGGLWVVALLTLRARLGKGHARPPRPGSGQRPEQRWPSYSAMERRVGFASRSPRIFDRAMKPLLTRVAATVLRDRTGIDLYTDPHAARRVLGDEAWWLVDPGRELAEDSGSPGIGPDRIEPLLDRLEQL